MQLTRQRLPASSLTSAETHFFYPLREERDKKERSLLRVGTPSNNLSERAILSIKWRRDDTLRVASRDPLQKTITRQPMHTHIAA